MKRTSRGIVEVADGLAVLRTRLPVPYKAALRASPGWVTGRLARRALRASRQLDFDDPVLWSYTPLGWYFRGRFQAAPMVYDLVDDYIAQSNYSHLSLQGAHEALIRSARLVFCTTDGLRDSAIAAGARHAEVMGNAADIELFMRARRPVDVTAEARRPYLLFWGAVTGEKLDLATIVELSRCVEADIDLVFVGPATSEVKGALLLLSNVRLLQTRSQEDLLPLVAGCLACFIPYKESNYTKSLSALKLYEAFAAGKQVIISGIPAAEAVARHVWIARSVPEWEEAIHRVRSGDRRPPPPDVQAHSWDQKAARCLDQIENCLGGSDGLSSRVGEARASD